jgi:hypothetical protein
MKKHVVSISPKSQNGTHSLLLIEIKIRLGFERFEYSFSDNCVLRAEWHIEQWEIGQIMGGN